MAGHASSTTLGLRMVLSSAALLLGVVTIAAVSWWGLTGISRELDAALQEYQAIRTVYEAGRHINRAADLLSETTVDEAAVEVQLTQATGPLRRLREELPGSAAQHEATDGVMADLAAIRAGLADGSLDATEAQSMLRQMLGFVSARAGDARKAIEAADTRASNRRDTAIGLVAGLTVVVLLTMAGIAAMQYRSVVGPLGRLRAAVRRVAGGRFDERVPIERDREFRELADDFNQMAAELHELYRNLEQKVQQQSRELVRSERLASVGFLAAGVAHEINNPLAIMSGHAEIALRQMPESDTDTAMIREARHALTIVRDEAFRCKRIIERLLTMARGGDGTRERIDPAVCVREVIDLVAGLPRYRNRRIDLAAEHGSACVTVDPSELKQVLLNLMVNALEATDQQPDERVSVRIVAESGHVALTVSDNGQGMDAATLSRVFEPFFTTKRGASTNGMGLGLSIAHAIVQNHGGTLTAASDGPGQGCRLTITLPTAASPNTQPSLTREPR